MRLTTENYRKYGTVDRVWVARVVLESQTFTDRSECESFFHGDPPYGDRQGKWGA